MTHYKMLFRLLHPVGQTFFKINIDTKHLLPYVKFIPLHLKDKSCVYLVGLKPYGWEVPHWHRGTEEILQADRARSQLRNGGYWSECTRTCVMFTLHTNSSMVFVFRMLVATILWSRTWMCAELIYNFLRFSLQILTRITTSTSIFEFLKYLPNS